MILICSPFDKQNQRKVQFYEFLEEIFFSKKSIRDADGLSLQHNPTGNSFFAIWPKNPKEDLLGVVQNITENRKQVKNSSAVTVPVLPDSAKKKTKTKTWGNSANDIKPRNIPKISRSNSSFSIAETAKIAQKRHSHSKLMSPRQRDSKSGISPSMSMDKLADVEYSDNANTKSPRLRPTRKARTKTADKSPDTPKRRRRPKRFSAGSMPTIQLTQVE